MGQIYKITNKITNKSYIGATIDCFVDRYSGRWWANTHNRELQDDAYRYGAESFEIEILQDNIPIEDLAEVEFDMISVHGTLSPAGYNKSSTKTKFKPKEDPIIKKIRLDRLRREKIRRDFYRGLKERPTDIITAIKTFRKIVGKTQEDFAKLQNVSLRILTEIEQGQGNPTIETLEKLFRGSGLTIAITTKTIVNKNN